MFDEPLVVVYWLFDEVTTLARFVWSSGWVGKCVILIPLAREVVHIFKKIY